MALFFDGEKELLFFRVELLFGLVGVKLELGPVHQLEVIRILQQAHEAFRAGRAQFDPVEEQPDLAFEFFQVGRV